MRALRIATDGYIGLSPLSLASSGYLFLLTVGQVFLIIDAIYKKSHNISATASAFESITTTRIGSMQLSLKAIDQTIDIKANVNFAFSADAEQTKSKLTEANKSRAISAKNAEIFDVDAIKPKIDIGLKRSKSVDIAVKTKSRQDLTIIIPS